MGDDKQFDKQEKFQLPEEVACAVYWLNVAGRTMVADFLTTWAEDKILAYEGLEGIKNGAFSRLEKAEHELEQQTHFKYAANERADKLERELVEVKHDLERAIADHSADLSARGDTEDEHQLLNEALAGLVGLAEQANLDTHGFVIHAKRFLIQRGVLPVSDDKPPYVNSLSSTEKK